MANAGSNTMLRFIADLDEIRWWDWPLLLASDFEVDWRFTETPTNLFLKPLPRDIAGSRLIQSAEDFCTSLGRTRGEPC